MSIKMTGFSKDLQRFRELWSGFQPSRVVLTANNLGIFDHLTTGRTAAELARRLKTDPRATEILLDALASLELLRKTGRSYRNTPLSRRFLVRTSPAYQGDMLHHADQLWKSWSNLDEVVRTGKPMRAGSRDFDVFLRAMHNNSVLRAKDIVDAVGLKGVKTALDLGGGPGTYSIELARRGVAVTHFDMPEAKQIAKKLFSAGDLKNVRFIGGDYYTDAIGSGYDLVLISQIIHSMSIADTLSLLRKARKSLNPGGRIAIHEFLLAENRAAPPPGALFSINMLVNTEAGRSYTVKEMKGFLSDAGLGSIKTKRLGPTVLVMGVKK